MTTHRTTWAGLLALTAACASSPTPTGGGGVTLTPGVRCYEGHTVTFDAKETAVAQTEVLVRRSVKPDDKLILDEIVSYDRTPGKPPNVFRVYRTVDGSEFKLKDDFGAMTGTGILDGPPWAWTSWTEEVVLEDGTKIVGAEEVGDGIRSERKLYDANYQLLMLFRENLRPIPDASCLAKLEAAFAAAAQAP